MAEMNTNLFRGGGLVKTSQQQSQIELGKNAVKRTWKIISAPVFDFFTKEAKPEEQEIVDYEAEIAKYEMRSAITQRILNDVDPKSRTHIDFVI